jgi:hypothetical protein
VIAKLEALGCDPIEAMARLAVDQASWPELRGKLRELACCMVRNGTIDHLGDRSFQDSVNGIGVEFVSSNSEVTDYPGLSQRANAPS